MPEIVQLVEKTGMNNSPDYRPFVHRCKEIMAIKKNYRQFFCRTKEKSE